METRRRILRANSREVSVGIIINNSYQKSVPVAGVERALKLASFSLRYTTMPLRETIIQAIRHRGPLSFHDFMEMALYYPGEGYYTADNDVHIVHNTAQHPESTSLIGGLLARQLEEMWKLLDKNSFTIVEYGAGPGNLCRGIFDYFRNRPNLYENLHYCIIEPCDPVKRRRQQQVCSEAEWFDTIEAVPYEPDCILSNEVVNHFAVHEVVMQQELMEIFVDHNNGFVEIARPAREELKQYLAEMNVSLPRGYRTEINMDALHWLRRNANALRKGFMLTIGHGFDANEFFSLARHRGNLVCENAEAAPETFYDTAGEKCILSKVNFTALHHWGRRFGLECCGFTSQAHFLHGLGLLPALDEIFTNGQSCKEKIVQLYRRIMNLSTHFKILIQQKGLQEPRLTGLQFAKNYV